MTNAEYRTKNGYFSPYVRSEQRKHPKMNYTQSVEQLRLGPREREPYESDHSSDIYLYEGKKSGNIHIEKHALNLHGRFSGRSNYQEGYYKRHQFISTLRSSTNSWLSDATDRSYSTNCDEPGWSDNNRKRSFVSISLTDDSSYKSRKKQERGRKGTQTVNWVSLTLNLLMAAALVYYFVFRDASRNEKQSNLNSIFEAPSISPTGLFDPTVQSPSLIPVVQKIPTSSLQQQRIQFIHFNVQVTCPYDIDALVDTMQNALIMFSNQVESNFTTAVEVKFAPSCNYRHLNQMRRLEQIYARLQVEVQAFSISETGLNQICEEVTNIILTSTPGSEKVTNYNFNIDSTFEPSFSPTYKKSDNPSGKPNVVQMSSKLPSSRPSMMMTTLSSIGVSSTSSKSNIPSSLTLPSVEPSLSPTICDSSKARKNIIALQIMNASGINYDSSYLQMGLDFTVNNDIDVNPCFSDQRILQRYFMAMVYISWGRASFVSLFVSECRWGNLQIICDDKGAPIRLHLEESQLKGTIPRELMYLNELTVLELGWNQLTGPLPDNLEMLSKLEVFDIKYNSITGEFPWDLTVLTRLRKIDISHVPMTGTIPDEMGNLISLEWLDLQHSGFSGTIPQSVRSLPNLIKVWVYGGNLTWQ